MLLPTYYDCETLLTQYQFYFTKVQTYSSYYCTLKLYLMKLTKQLTHSTSHHRWVSPYLSDFYHYTTTQYSHARNWSSTLGLYILLHIHTVDQMICKPDITKSGAVKASTYSDTPTSPTELAIQSLVLRDYISHLKNQSYKVQSIKGIHLQFLPSTLMHTWIHYHLIGLLIEGVC